MKTNTNPAATETTPSVETLRAEYREIRRRSHEENAKTFDAAVLALLAERGITTPSPVQFVKAARAVRFPCRRCAGSGIFVTYVENGVPRGPGGVCYRCGGRGSQNDEDARRNYGADNHAFAAAVRQMFGG